LEIQDKALFGEITISYACDLLNLAHGIRI